jgi:hypothetical protein
MFMRVAESESLIEIEDKLVAAGFPENSGALDAITSVERRRYGAYLFAQRVRFDNQLHQYEAGLLGELAYQRTVDVIRRVWIPRWRAFGTAIEPIEERESFREQSGIN